MERKLYSLLLFLILPVTIWAARVDTIQVKSPSMDKDIQVVVIAPDASYRRKPLKCPVVYLLHGYSGNAKTWIHVKENLPEIADEKGIIFVCPDGKNSWYWDSPMNADYRYETFVSSELVSQIDKLYPTIPDRTARAITGLSMGGHGALWNAIRNQEVFGAAGSMSGGVDIRPFPLNWEMDKQLGEMAANRDVWNEYSVINQIDRLQGSDIKLIIDCGEGDFFLEVNRNLHQRLLGLGVDHDFISRTWKHTHEYLDNPIGYQILFFDKFFNKP